MVDGAHDRRRRDAEAQLIGRAVRDAAFRAEILGDPKAAVERELSALTGQAVTLPAHVKVVVHEETADTYHLVLPPVPPGAGQLSDAELAGVAGGKYQITDGLGCQSRPPC